jgi:Fe-S oxidoreductase
MAFECSLCGLCRAVCPAGLDPAAMFLDIRREAQARGQGDLPEHGGILAYEAKGTSRRFTHYALPEGCRTVLFPGCALPGTRPAAVRRLFTHLRRTDPSLGIVLDCCLSPSHGLGRQGHFQAMFGEMRDWLLARGVEKVLVACPNCHRVFRTHGAPLQVSTIYEALAAGELPPAEPMAGEVTIHDPCPMRDSPEAQAAVRSLVRARGVTVTEMEHTGETTLCCGEGGTVAAVDHDLAGSWGRARHREARGRRMITSCAGCVNHLRRGGPTSHVLDLLFTPSATMEGRETVAGTPLTYLNRLRLKSWFRR